MAKKKFDKEMYDVTDQKAKSAGIYHVMHSIQDELYVVENPDRYGIDLLILDSTGEAIHGIEVEVKMGWSGASFPFTSLHIPKRKQKFAELDMPVNFFVFNREFTHLISIDKDRFLDADTKIMSNKYVQRELFKNIQIKQSDIRKTKDGRKRRFMA